MKIVVNKEAALKRTEDIVGRVMSEAKSCAEQGKVHFSMSLKSDEMNGIDVKMLGEMIAKESDNTVVFRFEWKLGDSSLYFSVVEPGQETEES
jgi:hypothetical protein